MNDRVTTPLGVGALAVAVLLLWSAFTGQSPLDELRKVLRTGRFDGSDAAGGGRPLDLSTGPVEIDGRVYSEGEVTNDGSIFDGTTGTRVEIPGLTSGAWPKDPTNLVRIGQGNHRLTPPAALSFAAVEQAFGRQIMVSDSYRPQAGQTASANANPNRFGSDSAHPEGRAVDVDLRAIGANPQGEPTNWRNDPVYARLAGAFEQAGWCNYQLRSGTARGRTREPWHFAYQVCK